MKSTSNGGERRVGAELRAKKHKSNKAQYPTYKFHIIVLVLFAFMIAGLTKLQQPTQSNITATSTATGTIVAEEIKTPEKGKNEPSDKEIVQTMARRYGISPKMLDELIMCESSYNKNARHDGGRGAGLTGFHRTTFNAWEKKIGEDLNYNSSYDQIKLMSWAISQGSEYADDWSSWRRYQKYGTCNITTIRKNKLGVL